MRANPFSGGHSTSTVNQSVPCGSSILSVRTRTTSSIHDNKTMEPRQRKQRKIVSHTPSTLLSQIATSYNYVRRFFPPYLLLHHHVRRTYATRGQYLVRAHFSWRQQQQQHHNSTILHIVIDQSAEWNARREMLATPQPPSSSSSSTT